MPAQVGQPVGMPAKEDIGMPAREDMGMPAKEDSCLSGHGNNQD
jgi:hypothetical protein